jgi:hypothetical protein
MHIALASAAAAQKDPSFSCPGQVIENFSGRGIFYDRTRRHGNHYITAVAAVTLFSFACFAVFRPVHSPCFQVREGL